MPSEIGSALKRLFVALLNATLLLAVIALVLAVTLVVQVRGLAQEARQGLHGELVALQAQIEVTRQRAQAALAVIEAAPAPASPGAIAPQPRPEIGEARDTLRALIDDLARFDPVTAPAEAGEGLLQRLVFAIFAVAARALLETESQSRPQP